jgi:hypothetical protein
VISGAEDEDIADLGFHYNTNNYQTGCSFRPPFPPPQRKAETMATNYLALGLALFVVMSPAGARLAEGGVEVRVRLIDADLIIGQDLSTAKDITSRILMPAGVRLRWDEGKPSRPPAGIEIRFVESAPKSQPDGSLAEALPFSAGGVRIAIFLDRVRNFAKRDPLFEPRILGHVLAHEIGHVLRGTDAHSWTGVMKAHWDDSDYRAMRARGLRFSAEDAATIRLRLVR